jgi:WD40 repeat protein
MLFLALVAALVLVDVYVLPPRLKVIPRLITQVKHWHLFASPGSTPGAGGNNITAVSLGPSATGLLAAGTDRGGVYVWQYRSGATPARCMPLPSAVVSLALNYDGSSAVVGYAGGEILIWDVRSDREVSRTAVHDAGSGGTPGKPQSLHFQPGGQGFACYDIVDEAVRYWSLGAPQQLKPRQRVTKGAVAAAALSADVLFLAEGLYDGKVLLWNLQTTQNAGVLPSQGAPVQVLAVRSDGQCVVVAGIAKHSPDTATLWDVPGQRVLLQVKAPGPIAALDFSDDGNVIAGGGPGFAVVWDAGTGQPIQVLAP